MDYIYIKQHFLLLNIFGSYEVCRMKKRQRQMDQESEKSGVCF